MIEKSIHTSDTVLSALKTLPESNISIQPEKKGSIVDIYFAITIFILSFMIVRFTNVFEIGWLHTIVMIAYIAISAVYVWWNQYSISRINKVLLAFLFLECIPNAIFTNTGLKIFNILFINILQMYWLLDCCGHLSNGRKSDWILLDFAIGILVVPFTCMKKAYLFVTAFSLKRLSLKTISMIFMGLLISVPLLVVIIPQLALADEVFSSVFYKVFSSLDQVFSYLLTFIFTIPLFMFYYSAVYGNVFCPIDSMKRKQKVEHSLHRLSKISPVIMVTIEIMLCFVYVVFISTTIYSIYQNVIASNVQFVFSYYARNGFFELCRITIINFVVLMMIELYMVKGNFMVHTIVKRILCLETLALIMTALFKMGLYINAYGFTYKRIYAAWLMFVLFGTFVLLFYHTFKKGNVILDIVRYSCICFMILNMINVDNIINQSKHAYHQSSDSMVYQHSFSDIVEME